MKIRLLLTGVPSMVRDGVLSLLTAIEDFDLVAVEGREAETVATIERTSPDVLVVVVDAGDSWPPPMIVTSPARDRGTRMLVLADGLDDDALDEAVRQGISGFVLKGDDTDSLVAAIRTTTRGDAWLSPAVARQFLELYRSRDCSASGTAQPAADERIEPERSDRVAALSERERMVVRLLANGLSNAEIAAELTLARSTVKTHVSRILAKLELRDRVQLAAFAHQNDIA